MHTPSLNLNAEVRTLVRTRIYSYERIMFLQNYKLQYSCFTEKKKDSPEQFKDHLFAPVSGYDTIEDKSSDKQFMSDPYTFIKI